MKNPIPTSRAEDVLFMYGQLLSTLESRVDGDKNAVLDRETVRVAYNVLNDIGYTKERPAWETRAAKKPIMDCNDVKTGLRIRITNLGDTKGMLINSRHLDCRQKGITGTVDGYVPGHGGDVWFVKHDDGQVGAYSYTEMEAI